MKRNNTAPKPNEQDRRDRARTRPFAIHQHNPAGSKFFRRAYKAKLGSRASYQSAKHWYEHRVK